MNELPMLPCGEPSPVSKEAAPLPLARRAMAASSEPPRAPPPKEMAWARLVMCWWCEESEDERDEPNDCGNEPCVVAPAAAEEESHELIGIAVAIGERPGIAIAFDEAPAWKTPAALIMDAVLNIGVSAVWNAMGAVAIDMPAAETATAALTAGIGPELVGTRKVNGMQGAASLDGLAQDLNTALALGGRWPVASSASRARLRRCLR